MRKNQVIFLSDRHEFHTQMTNKDQGLVNTSQATGIHKKSGMALLPNAAQSYYLCTYENRQMLEL